MVIPIFTAKTTKNGIIKFDDIDQFNMYVSAFHPDTDVEVIVRKPKKQRSDRQNKYFHKVIRNMYAEASGLSLDQAKYVLKSDVLGFEFESKGKKYWFVPDTASLSTVEFEDFNQHCRELTWERYQVNIPLPNEVVF